MTALTIPPTDSAVLGCTAHRLDLELRDRILAVFHFRIGERLVRVPEAVDQKGAILVARPGDLQADALAGSPDVFVNAR